MSEMITVRDIEIVTAEIKTIERQIVRTAVHGYIEIGRRLTEAKEIVGHGGWGKYLEENVRYSQQWATDLMNLYKEYGGQQESLFENFANSQSFGNLDITKHILLLAVPAEERTRFVEDNDVENKTVRELKAAIKERDEAISGKEYAERGWDSAKEQVEQLEDALDAQKRRAAGLDKYASEKADEAERLKVAKERAEKTHAAVNEQLEKVKKQLEKAKANEKAAKEELAKVKENPDIPESVMEKLRKETDAAVAEAATAELRKELEAAQKAVAEATAATEQAQAAAKAAAEQAEAAQKQIRLANPNMVLLNDCLKRVQKEVEGMAEVMKKISAEDPDTGRKLTENVRTKLLPNLLKALEV